jgi:hypothetical protein
MQRARNEGEGEEIKETKREVISLVEGKKAKARRAQAKKKLKSQSFRNGAARRAS